MRDILNDVMMETVKHIIRKHFGDCAFEVGKPMNITNNHVYPFMAAGDRYFLKLYRNKDWPEEGKIPFVYRRLSDRNIPHAGLVAYSRDDVEIT